MRSKLGSLFAQIPLLLKDLTVGDRGTQAPAGRFVKGINFGGASVTIERCPSASYNTALANGLTVDGVQVVKTNLIPQPYASRATRAMLNSVICKARQLDITQALPNGTYEVYIWLIENYRSEWHAIGVTLQGESVAAGIGKLPLGHWARYGPYSASVTTGTLQLTLATPEGVDAHIMGLSIFQPVSAKTEPTS